MYYNRFPFSLILNDGIAFPNMPKGEILVFGKHDQAIARCDYEGNMDNIHPSANVKENETERLVLLNNDRDTVFAWHGHREKQTPEFSNGRYLGRVSWVKALKNRFPKSGKRKRRYD